VIEPEEGKRLRWRCRRGILELDLVLGAFLDQHYAHLSRDEQEAFARLLTLPDPTLLAYVHGLQEPDDNELRNLVRKLR
jgi:antitoxin CptB